MARGKRASIHPEVRRLLGYGQEESDAALLKNWRLRATRVCKPCWELRYCPYGPLVEQSPLLPTTLAEATGHIKYLDQCLKTGILADGRELGVSKRRAFQREIANFNPGDYPETIPRIIEEMQCTVFGHVCPVVFSAEGFTETSEERRTGRYIPFQINARRSPR
jgi:hypothetical protein